MPCYHPVDCFRSRQGKNENGKWPIVFTSSEGYRDKSLQIPCGKCIGCRIEHAKQWAVRCYHEGLMHEQSCFITLTYDNENLPLNGSLDKRDFVLFMKRLRKQIGKVRFFHCGEYGEQYGRPHHHACLFGWVPEDKILWKKTNNVEIYISEFLRQVWGMGHITVGDMTYESAQYCARYILKKLKGKDKELFEDSGMIQEYTSMSRKPGIGQKYLEKYGKTIVDLDSVVINGFEMKPPRYYTEQLERTYPDEIKENKRKRANYARKNKKTQDELDALERNLLHRLTKKVRQFEESIGEN